MKKEYVLEGVIGELIDDNGELFVVMDSWAGGTSYLLIENQKGETCVLQMTKAVDTDTAVYEVTNQTWDWVMEKG